MGEPSVVQGQDAIGAWSYGQALEVKHSSGRHMVMKVFHDAGQCAAEIMAYGAIMKGRKALNLPEAACPFGRPGILAI